VGFAYGYGQSVKFVEEAGLLGGWVRGEGAAGQIGEQLIAAAVAVGRLSGELVALDDAAQILVGNGDGVVERVEQNRVGGFRTDSGQSQKALT